MARRRRADRFEVNAEINVVNLIDVMLLLMVIFMLTAPMMQGGVQVALPRADVRPLDARQGLIVTVSRDEAILVDDEQVSMAEFEKMAKDASAVGLVSLSRKWFETDSNKDVREIDTLSNVESLYRRLESGRRFSVQTKAGAAPPAASSRCRGRRAAADRPADDRSPRRSRGRR